MTRLGVLQKMRQDVADLGPRGSVGRLPGKPDRHFVAVEDALDIIDKAVAQIIWSELEEDPTFVAGMAQGEADIAAGRWFHFDTKTGETTPNPDWPKDGPQPGDPR
jgi:hypothetical protein